MAKRYQSQDDRDLAGAQARRERARDQLDDLADAIPDEAADADDTRPVTLLNEREAEIWDRISRVKRYARGRAKDTGDQILEAMGKRPPAERLASLESRVRMLIAILAAVGSLAIGSLFTTGKLLYDRGVEAGELEQRVLSNTNRLDRIERELFDSRRRHDAEPAFLQPRTGP